MSSARHRISAAVRSPEARRRTLAPRRRAAGLGERSLRGSDSWTPPDVKLLTPSTATATGCRKPTRRSDKAQPTILFTGEFGHLRVQTPLGRNHSRSGRGAERIPDRRLRRGGGLFGCSGLTPGSRHARRRVSRIRWRWCRFSCRPSCKKTLIAPARASTRPSMSGPPNIARAFRLLAHWLLSYDSSSGDN